MKTVIAAGSNQHGKLRIRQSKFLAANNYRVIEEQVAPLVDTCTKGANVEISTEQDFKSMDFLLKWKVKEPKKVVDVPVTLNGIEVGRAILVDLDEAGAHFIIHVKNPEIIESFIQNDINNLSIHRKDDI